MMSQIKQWIKKSVLHAFKLIPGQKCIIFESVPDLSDSPKPVFDSMLEMGLAQKYKFVWLVSNRKKPLPHYPNTVYVDNQSLWNLLCYYWYLMHAKCLISCNKFLPTSITDQTSFYITHGTPIKCTSKGYVAPEGIDYVLVASEHMKAPCAADLNADISKFYGLGYPRNDILHHANRDLHKYLPGDYDKIIVWYPTFRQHKSGRVNNGGNALPIIHDAAKAQELNEIAKRNRVLIVMKPHFAQDLSYIKSCNLSNIRFIDDSFFVTHGLSSYEFVGSCDALVTDYSSIYYDYLLCNKPIAAVWEDVEEYRANPGFSVDVDYYLKGAEKVYTIADFESFIRNMATGNDILKAERAEINALVNYASDGKNTERVLNFIIDKAKL